MNHPTPKRQAQPSILRTLPAAVAGALPLMAAAQEAPPTPPTQSVVVVGTRLAERPFDVPASVDRIGADAIREDRLQVNIGEALAAVPGLLARDRQNYAQDVQL